MPDPRSSRCRDAGGGEIRPIPGSVCRSRAISAVTLWPGSWPPSPGLEPWAILIWSSSACAAYSAVTPNRPDATCLIRELRSSRKRAGSSPPSPQFERPPRRLNAIATVSCASAESEPCDMPPLEKRRRIDSTGSTSSIGTSGPAGTSSSRSRGSSGTRPSTSAAKRRYSSVPPRPSTARRSACAAETACSASATSGVVACGSPPGRYLT